MDIGRDARGGRVGRVEDGRCILVEFCEESVSLGVGDHLSAEGM